MTAKIHPIKDGYEKSRVMYIIEAAVEYFICIMVTSNYLVYLTNALGISDNIIAILSAFVSLGCSFQLLALLMQGTGSKKRFTILMTMLAELCFFMLYMMPMTKIKSGLRTGIFIAFLLFGHVFNNVVSPAKNKWKRGILQEGREGRFSSVNEVISLSSGMIFTMATGMLIDYFDARGNTTAVFILGGATILALSLIQLFSMIHMKEKEDDLADTTSSLERIKGAITDKATLLLLPVYILIQFIMIGTTSFFGTYALNDLGFTMTAVSVISTVYAIVRSIVSVPIGVLGDKFSFITSMSLGIFALALALFVNAMGGKISYIIYYMLYAIALAAINTGKVHLIFTYVPYNKRIGAMSLIFAISGAFGFISSIVFQPLFNSIKEAGNTFLGIENVYPQQVISMIGAICLPLVIIYLNTVIRKLPKYDKFKT